MNSFGSQNLHRWAAFTACLMLMFSVVPIAGGQDVGGCETTQNESCIQITALYIAEGHSDIVSHSEEGEGDGDNTIRVEFQNNGEASRQVRIEWTATWGNGGEDSDQSATFTLSGRGLADSTRSTSWTWDGPPLEDRANTVTIKAEAVQVVAGGGTVQDERSITRPVVQNNFEIDFEEFLAPLEVGHTGARIANATIQNTGNVEDTARLTLSEDVAGWELSVEPAELRLQPGQSENVSIFATASNNVQDGNTEYVLQVETSEIRVTQKLRASQELTTPSLTDGENLRITMTPESQFADPGDTATYQGILFNPTGGEMDVVLEMVPPEGLEDDFTAYFGEDGSSTSISIDDLEPGAEFPFTFQVDVGGMALNNTHGWLLRATDQNVDSTVWLSINQQFGVGVVVNTEEIQDVEPGGLVAVPLDLTNLGNGNDTICIEADLPQGWSVDDDDNRCFTIDPVATDPGSTEMWNNTDNVNWVIDLDPWAAAGLHVIDFQAVSSDGSARADGSVNITILERTAPVVEPPAPSMRWVWDSANNDGEVTTVQETCAFGVVPGGSVSFDLELRNDGNIVGNFEFAANGPSGWGVTANTESMDFGDRTTSDEEDWKRTERITVAAAQGLGPDDPPVAIEFTLTDDTDGDRQDSVTCIFETAFPDLTVVESSAGLKDPGDLYAGYGSTLNFDVWNVGWRGTGQEITIRSVIEGPGFENITEHVIDPLASGESHMLSVEFIPPEPSDDSDDYTYTIEIDPDGLIDQPSEEENDGHDLRGAPKTLEGTFRVEDFGIEIIVPPGPTVIPEQHVSFEGNTAFKFANNGDLTQTLVISIEMTPSWASTHVERIDLARDAVHEVEFAFTTPSNPRTGEAKIVVSAHNETTSFVRVEETSRIKIDDDEPPAITGLTADTKHTLLGGTVNFTADIQDATGVADARLYVVAPDGQSGWVEMEGDKQGGAFEAMWRFEQLGFHEVHVWARDASVSNNTADTKDDPLMIEVLTTDKPHIRLVTPEDESAVRPGTNLVITVLSARPVVDMNYTLASPDPLITEVFGPIDLAPSNPVHIDTEEWSEGAVLLYLEARDSAGATASGNFSFIMDATSPEVQSIQLDPPGAGSGTEVNVLAMVTDNVAVASVVVRFEDADGRAQEWDMENVDGDEWTARIVVPENPVSVSVIATDTAGNRGYGELQYGGPDLDDDSRLLPALPVALILFAVASVLFVRRRRVKNR